MPIPQEYKSQQEKTFEEILLAGVEQSKGDLAIAIIGKAKEGDASAMKMVQAAMDIAKYKEDEQFIISDERFIEIILFIADILRGTQEDQPSQPQG